MSNNPIIQGKCPYCGEEKVRFADHKHFVGSIHTHTNENVPTCDKCHNDEIEIRKINNRRYKIVGKW